MWTRFKDKYGINNTQISSSLEKTIKEYLSSLAPSVNESRIITPKSITDFSVKTFMNGHALELLLDETLLVSLMQAIEHNLFEADIFIHPEFEKILFTLFCTNHIDWLQICTEIERFELRKLNSKMHYYPLLNKNKTWFSDEAKALLLPQLIYTQTGDGKFSHAQLRTLLGLCQQFPNSEQYFVANLHNDLIFNDQDKKSIRNTLATNESLFTISLNEKKRLLFLSFSLKNAIGLIMYQDQWFAHLGLVGKLDKDDIERGMKQQVRYTALPFNQYRDLGKVHNYENVSLFEVIMHDYYHSRVCSSIPASFHAAITAIIDTIRPIIGFQWTKAFWLLTDREFKYFFYNSGIDPTSISFGYFLDYGTGGDSLDYQSGGLFLPSRMTRQYGIHLGISDIGILFFLNMAMNKTTWETSGINFNRFELDYLHHFQLATIIKDELFEDFSLNILLYRIFELLKDITKVRIIKKIISANIDAWKPQLTYKRPAKNTQSTLFTDVTYKGDLLSKKLDVVMHDIVCFAINGTIHENRYDSNVSMNINYDSDLQEVDDSIQANIKGSHFNPTKLFILHKLIHETRMHKKSLGGEVFEWKSIKNNRIATAIENQINLRANEIWATLPQDQKELISIIPLSLTLNKNSRQDLRCSIM